MNTIDHKLQKNTEDALRTSSVLSEVISRLDIDDCRDSILLYYPIISHRL